MRKLASLLCLAVFLVVSFGFRPPRNLLEETEKRAFDFLWQEANPSNGLVKDRARNFTGDESRIASIASVGFALAALPAAVERRWVSREEARLRALVTVRFFADKLENVRGFYYHFVGMTTGKRVGHSELSSIDTALFLSGALVAREYFRDPAITRAVDAIYGRIDFQWMMNGGRTLSMGWTPEEGFIKHRWSDFNEGILLTLLAMGAPFKSAPPETWDHVRRKVGEYAGIAVIQSPPLFTHQYPQLFFDLRNKHDNYADYYQNSVNATLANQAFCRNEAARYKTYKEGYWGLTASDGPRGYKAYGAEPGGAVSDGTVAPTGAITSIMFTPRPSLEFLERLYSREREWLWGRYGFTDAFNLDLRWRSEDVIGIDQGAILLAIENYRTGLIWKLFQKAPEVKRARRLAGFRPGKRSIELPQPPVYRIPRRTRDFNWRKAPQVMLTSESFLDVGEHVRPEDLQVRVAFAWDATHLYFRADIEDDSRVSQLRGEAIWRNDCFELFVDPDGQGFRWGDARDIQLGFSPAAEGGEGLNSWSWCQKEDPVAKGRIEAALKKRENGYVIYGKIPWRYLRITPRSGLAVLMTPAIHDADKDRTEVKYSWYFLSRDGRNELGRMILE